MRILIVEDQHDIREVLFETLNDAGHTVTLAANFPQAAAALTPPEGQHAPRPAGWWDLLLTDMLLPGANGLELAIRARAHGVRVLLCSGHPDELAEFERRGIPHLRKPFALRHLLDRITAVMAAPDSI